MNRFIERAIPNENANENNTHIKQPFVVRDKITYYGKFLIDCAGIHGSHLGAVKKYFSNNSNTQQRFGISRET